MGLYPEHIACQMPCSLRPSLRGDSPGPLSREESELQGTAGVGPTWDAVTHTPAPTLLCGVLSELRLTWGLHVRICCGLMRASSVSAVSPQLLYAEGSFATLLTGRALLCPLPGGSPLRRAPHPAGG